MADYRKAILQATLAADRLHRDFDSKANSEKGDSRIDVFDMFVRLDIPMLFRPLASLLGAYLNAPSPGVMVTTKRPLSIQRFTAGHELGHAILKHRPSLDDEEAIFRATSASTSKHEEQEIQANAFASQLLMPRWLVAHHMTRQHWTPDDVKKPEVIYQLSLRLGTSYSAMCYSLLTNKIIRRSNYDNVVEISPKVIKKSLIAPYEPENWYGDMWVITERDDGMFIEGSRTDLVVLSFVEHCGSGYIWRLDDLADAGLVIVDDARSHVGAEELIGGIVSRKVIAESHTGAKGLVRLREVRPWQVAGKAIQSVDLDVDLSGPVTAGLLRAQREAALGAA